MWTQCCCGIKVRDLCTLGLVGSSSRVVFVLFITGRKSLFLWGCETKWFAQDDAVRYTMKKKSAARAIKLHIYSLNDTLQSWLRQMIEKYRELGGVVMCSTCSPVTHWLMYCRCNFTTLCSYTIKICISKDFGKLICLLLSCEKCIHSYGSTLTPAVE